MPPFRLTYEYSSRLRLFAGRCSYFCYITLSMYVHVDFSEPFIGTSSNFLRLWWLEHPGKNIQPSIVIEHAKHTTLSLALLFALSWQFFGSISIYFRTLLSVSFAFSLLFSFLSPLSQIPPLSRLKEAQKRRQNSHVSRVKGVRAARGEAPLFHLMKLFHFTHSLFPIPLPIF